MKNINSKIQDSFSNNLPFVVYNKPNSKNVSGIFPFSNKLNTKNKYFSKPGFVFAPFDSDKEAIFFSLDESEFVEESFLEEKTPFEEKKYRDIASKEKHIKLVKEAVKAIENQEFKKVVLSRKLALEIADFDLISVYTRLLNTYPNAFVYVWFHPLIGLWFGATPETLVKVENNNFSTMALAGTQAYNEQIDPSWSSKEIEEQEFVTEYIVKKLSNFTTEVKVFETETVKAGSLLHLRTLIEGELSSEKGIDGLSSLVNLLHPTPAVCGLPKEASRQFIMDNEGYDRSFYTGYLGELNFKENTNKNSHLFVNLRCMEMQRKMAVIYVGGGITKESNPEAEWEETVAKSNVMLKVL